MNQYPKSNVRGIGGAIGEEDRIEVPNGAQPGDNSSGKGYQLAENEAFQKMLASLPDEQRAIVNGLSTKKLNEVMQRWQKKRDEQMSSRAAALNQSQRPTAFANNELVVMDAMHVPTQIFSMLRDGGQDIVQEGTWDWGMLKIWMQQNQTPQALQDQLEEAQWKQYQTQVLR
ncbi:gall11 coactivator protein [Fusarium austroafricanum]|uniref:Gall11 coactivator protein n=1 Tax=Fusarium austroafricanum TaxID=2364996 RepID=A0A8H4K4V4_9HYPO|nr:gall11 coactivator protein [Fusarium austroafricanum]